MFLFIPPTVKPHIVGYAEDIWRIYLCCLQKQLKHYNRWYVTRHVLMHSSPRFRTQVGVCVQPKQAKAQIAYSLCQIHQFIPAHLN